MSGVKLAPIFEKNFAFKASVSRKKRVKKTSTSKRERKPVVVEIIDEESSSTDVYYTDDEASNKKAKPDSSDDVVELTEERSSELQPKDVWTGKNRALTKTGRVVCDLPFEELLSWLLEWKNKRVNNPYAEDDASSTDLRSCVLICGPTGVGKTSLCYAVANELNFKVFEVNCSSRRNGKAIIEQMKEVTESLTIHRNTAKQSNDNCDHSSGSGNSLLKYFTKSHQNSMIQRDKKYSQNEDMKHLEALEGPLSLNSISFTSDSLILFDDVDIIFDEDDGFWKAVNILIDSGRPVVLTATDFFDKIATFMDDLKMVKVKPPTSDMLAQFLQRIALEEEENISLELCKNVASMFHCDVRRCLNELQFDEQRFKEPKYLHICTCEPMFSSSLYESGVLVDFMETLSISRINSYKEDTNSSLLEDIRCELTDLSASVYSEHWNCKYTSLLCDTSTGDGTLELPDIHNYTFVKPCIRDVILDYIPYLSEMSNAEERRRNQFEDNSRRRRRFHHYFDSISFFISDETRNTLRKFHSYCKHHIQFYS